jgi:hypothetical protein
MLAVSPAMRAVIVTSTLAMAACAAAPAGPGKPVSAEQSSIRFDHPLYPGVTGDYNQRVEAGRVNARSDRATFLGPAGMVIIQHSQTAGETYIRAGDVADMVQMVGEHPEKNRLKAEGVLENSYPRVTWASFDLVVDDATTLSCVAIKRDGNAAHTGAASGSSSIILAAECREPDVEMGAAEAAALSGAIQTVRPSST